MKKRLIALIVFVLVVLPAKPVFAQMGMMGGANGEKSGIEAEINAILKSQNIENAKDINCADVTGEQFEKLGDVWMDYQIGNKAMHERMDTRMGGEGSEELKSAHIQMGKNYLGCSPDGYSGSMPMMYGYKNDNENYPSGMMGTWGMMSGHNGSAFTLHNPRFLGIHEVLCVITWLTFIIFLIAATRYLWRKTKN